MRTHSDMNDLLKRSIFSLVDHGTEIGKQIANLKHDSRNLSQPMIGEFNDINEMYPFNPFDTAAHVAIAFGEYCREQIELHNPDDTYNLLEEISCRLLSQIECDDYYKFAFHFDSGNQLAGIDFYNLSTDKEVIERLKFQFGAWEKKFSLHPYWIIQCMIFGFGTYTAFAASHNSQKITSDKRYPLKFISYINRIYAASSGIVSIDKAGTWVPKRSKFAPKVVFSS